MSKFATSLTEKHAALHDPALRRMAQEVAIVESKIKLDAAIATADQRAALKAADLQAEINAGVPQRRALATFMGKLAVADHAAAQGRNVDGSVKEVKADATQKNGKSADNAQAAAAA